MAEATRRARRAVELWGGVTWIASLQFFAVQAVVQLAWPVPYDPVRDSISDLGRVICTPVFCSPLHVLMNASFVLLGLCMAGGAVAAELSSPAVSPLSRVAAALLVVSGLGVIGLGLVPEDVSDPVHSALAVVAIPTANTGGALTGWALHRLRGMSLTGTIGVVAGVFGWVLTLAFAASNLGATALVPYAGLLERGAVYPILLALILSGGALVGGDWVDRVIQPGRVAITRMMRGDNAGSGRSSTPKP